MHKQNFKIYLFNLVMPCIVLGSITGAVIGAFIFGFKYMAHELNSFSVEVYDYVCTHPWLIPALLVVVAGFAAVMRALQKFAPQASGGGIPTSEGVLRGLMPCTWWRTLIGTFLASGISYTVGLPLGYEGPSVLMGVAIGKGSNQLFGHRMAWDRYVMTGGASAAFAVATGAPVSGIIFALEEAHKRFSAPILMVAMTSVMSAYGVASFLCKVSGLALVEFPFANLTVINISEWYIPVGLGIAVGLFACFYIIFSQKLYWLVNEKFERVPSVIKLMTVFVISVVAGLLLRDVLGSGQRLISIVAGNNCTFIMLLIYLAVKVFLVVACSSAGATGGLFIPILMIGAVLGGILGNLATSLGMDAQYYSVIVMVCIAAFMGSTTRSPLMSIVFAMEMMDGMSNIFALGVTVCVAFILPELFKLPPLYDIVMEKNLHNMLGKSEAHIYEVTLTITQNSPIIGKPTRDVFWPPNCLVLSVKREDSIIAHMAKNGDKNIHIGDVILLRYQTYEPEVAKTSLLAIVGEQEFMPRPVK